MSGGLCGGEPPLCFGEELLVPGQGIELAGPGRLTATDGTLSAIEHHKQSEGDRTNDTENLICRGGKPVGSVSAQALLCLNLPAPGKSSL